MGGWVRRVKTGTHASVVLREPSPTLARFLPTPRERRELEAIERLLRTWEDDGGVAGSVERLRSLLHANLGVSYRVKLEDRWTLEHIEVAGPGNIAEELHALFESSCADDTVVAYDPRRPAREERNVVVCPTMGLSEEEISRFAITACVGAQHHLRILLCDGASLLSWLGGIRSDPFTDREAALLMRVSGSFRSRFKLERQLGHAKLNIAALAAAMGALGTMAYIVAHDGPVAHANESGALELARRGRTLREELRAAIRDPTHPGYRVIALDIKACPDYHLLIFVGDRDEVERRTAVFRRRFALTARQAHITALLARGESNKEIAIELDISHRTVELHVAAVLKKFGSDTRARLIAQFWSPSAPDPSHGRR